MPWLREFWTLLAGHNPLSGFLYMFVTASVLNGLLVMFFRSRKIQPNGFKWKTYRNEAAIVLLNMALSGLFIGGLTSLLALLGTVSVIKDQTHWWVIAGEFALFFLGFDAWFYWFHRLMHKEPIYSLVHKLHHKSTAPNLLTTFSVNPLESLVNGGFVPVFTLLYSVHAPTLWLMTAFQGLMGLYVHSGYEFLPRWWNKTWVTKWFITATFHDQHHKYFNWNFGGFTTVWDRLCGTTRKKYEADFERIKPHPAKRIGEPVAAAVETATVT